MAEAQGSDLHPFQWHRERLYFRRQLFDGTLTVERCDNDIREISIDR